MTDIIVIAHDIRSTHNVGSLLRTCEGLGINHLYLTGYTPYPQTLDDERLPHIARKLTSQIHKTALGAENLVAWDHANDIKSLITQLQGDGYVVAALEQGQESIKLHEYKVPAKIALLLGREVEGIDTDLLQACDQMIEIPMFGRKESFNVVQAAAMTLYHLRFSSAA